MSGKAEKKRIGGDRRQGDRRKTVLKPKADERRRSVRRQESDRRRG